MAKQQYVRQYNSFRGVDFTSDPVDVADYRVQYAVNMWRDYENNNGSMIETIPGFRSLGWFGGDAKIYGLHHYRTTNKEGVLTDYVFVHVDNELRWTTTKEINFGINFVESNGVKDFMNESRSVSIMSNNKLIILDGEKIVIVEPKGNGFIARTSKEITDKSTSNTGKKTEVYAKYIPTVYSDGKKYEAENLFSEEAIERYNNSPPPTPNESGLLVYDLYALDLEEGVEVKMGNDTLTEGFSSTSDDTPAYLIDKGMSKIYIKGYVRAREEYEDGEGEFVAKNYGIMLTIKGKIKEISFPKSNKYPSFLDIEDKSNAIDIVSRCLCISVYDKKLFFTGNPEHPNMVFWTATDLSGNNNISYISIFNFLYTGVGMTPNKAMIASNATLMVFKGDTVQDGSVYYLTGFDVNVEDHEYLTRYYAVTEGAAGIGCIGGACNFMDDAVFISKRGLDAVGKQLTNLERSIVHRSTMVDRKLLAEDLSKAEMVEWKGYLVIAVNGHFYLADSRAMYTDETGNVQYEWFCLEGIGGYTLGTNGDYEKQYRYWSGALPSGEKFKNYQIKPDNNEEIVDVDVTNDANHVYYTNDGNNYLCYLDDEYTVKDNATFFPAKNLVVINDILFFSADNGAVYCFNTDKRGELPESIDIDDDGTDGEHDSKEDYVGLIPQKYYDFDGLSYPSGIITKTDNANAPYALKNTVNRSLVLRVGADPRTHSTVSVEVLTDRNPTFDLVDKKDTTKRTENTLDFSALSYDPYPFAFLTYREHERKWIEKKYKIFNEAFRGILRLHSLSYRYEIGGNIK